MFDADIASVCHGLHSERQPVVAAAGREKDKRRDMGRVVVVKYANIHEPVDRCLDRWEVIACVCEDAFRLPGLRLNDHH